MLNRAVIWSWRSYGDVNLYHLFPFLFSGVSSETGRDWTLLSDMEKGPFEPERTVVHMPADTRYGIYQVWGVCGENTIKTETVKQVKFWAEWMNTLIFFFIAFFWNFSLCSSILNQWKIWVRMMNRKSNEKIENLPSVHGSFDVSPISYFRWLHRASRENEASLVFPVLAEEEIK